MKTCSKCRVDLPRDSFVKSGRYLDGLYPSCKECRKKTRTESLTRKPFCWKCKKVRHIPNHPWCDSCLRKASGKGPAKFSRRKKMDGLCSRCRKEKHLPYHRYCRVCKVDSTRKWNKFIRKPRTKARRAKETSRRYITKLVERGKVQKTPCPHCGSLDVEFHHFDYKPRTRNGIFVCQKYHVILERQKRAVDKTGQFELLLC
jgi:hypothetical protein